MLLRALLFVPHYIVIAVWSVLTLPAVAVAWLALLIEGRLPTWLQRFLGAYVRYTGQASAWFNLLSGRYPDPLHTLEHPFAIDVPDRPPQQRLTTLARPVLAVPALILASVLRVVLSVSAAHSSESRKVRGFPSSAVMPIWYSIAAATVKRISPVITSRSRFCERCTGE